MAGPPDSKKATPLMWIILGVVVILLGIALLGPKTHITTPSGKTAPSSPPSGAAPPQPSS